MKLGKKKQEEIAEKQETPDEELVAYLGYSRLSCS